LICDAENRNQNKKLILLIAVLVVVATRNHKKNQNNKIILINRSTVLHSVHHIFNLLFIFYFLLIHTYTPECYKHRKGHHFKSLHITRIFLSTQTHHHI